LPEAEAVIRESLSIRRKLLGDTHLETGRSFALLIEILANENKASEMRSFLNEQPQAAARWRGEAFARQGRWKEAAAEFILAIDQTPEAVSADNYEDWHKLAALLVASGQLDGYREQCRKSAERFGHTTDPDTADGTARDCMILPDSGADLEVVAKLADIALGSTNHPVMASFEFCKGLAEYRQGRFASAVAWLNKVFATPVWSSCDVQANMVLPMVQYQLAEPKRDVQASMVLAMALNQLKQTNEAHAAFAKGAEIERTKLPEAERSCFDDDWPNRLIAHALMREAKTLIEGNTE
jgi:tetratricopeptide (TPR) repeat protein